MQGVRGEGASGASTLSVRDGENRRNDTSIIGYTPNMIDIDTRTLEEAVFTRPKKRTRRVRGGDWVIAGRAVLSK